MGCWKPPTFQDCLSPGSLRQVSWWLGHSRLHPKAGGCKCHTEWVASLCSGPLLVSIPGFSCVSLPSLIRMEPQSWEPAFGDVECFGYKVEGFTHRWFTFPQPVSRRKMGRGTACLMFWGAATSVFLPFLLHIPNAQLMPPFLLGGMVEGKKGEQSRAWDPERFASLWNGVRDPKMSFIHNKVPNPCMKSGKFPPIPALLI